MLWIDNALDRLRAMPVWGYHAHAQSASEPAALAALALHAWGKTTEAEAPARWLAALQSADGAVGITADQATPGWPTAWAILAWHTIGGFKSQIARGSNWLLGISGKPLERNPDMGHDTTLIGWPWVEGTHSWLEPTALAVLALFAIGHAQHHRTQEAQRLLYDRLLPSGGANYGNTTVLQQALRPHVQPTGLALLALSRQRDVGEKVPAACRYLQNTVNDSTTTVSLAYALLGLSAWGLFPDAGPAWLNAAADRALRGDASAYKLSLLLLAAQPQNALSVPAPFGEAQHGD